METYAIVLDYLPYGYANRPDAEPIAQVLGVDYFTLLEVVPKGQLEIGERIFVGKGEREKIKFIKRRIFYNDLTSTAKAELRGVVERIVRENEKKFVDFFNKAGPITVRLHQLELLPGIGKKHMWEILRERQKKPFESFEDIKKRIPMLQDPFKMVVERIESEIMGGEKYYIFVKPPRR